jgi:signal transduction histidine kinase
MSSLQRQFRRNMLLTLLVAMAALLFLVNAGIERLTRDYVTSRLQHDAESLIASLSRATDGAWRLDKARLSTVYDRVRSGHYYYVLAGDRPFRSRSLWDHPLNIGPLPRGKSRSTLMDGMGDEQWLTWSQGVTKQGDNLTVWVAEDIHPLEVTRYAYSAWALALVAGTLLVLLGVQQWLLKRGFRRLDRVRDAIRDLREGRDADLGRDVPSEVQPLVAEIDRLLSQLYQRVMRSRNALGNVAHELKRPLQHLTMLVESENLERREQLVAALEELRRLVDRELKRARIVGVSSPGRQLTAAEDLPPLIEVLGRLYADKTITTGYPPDLVLPQDRDDLLELLGNLLDNACKYAKQQVSLTITTEANGWRIRIEDDGPGVSRDRIDTLTRRGVRLDESVSGTGLGLAISQDICDSYGGRLSFSNRPEGGLSVTVWLPDEQVGGWMG